MSEIRYDLLFDEYVIIAPERLHRPMHNIAPKPPTQTPCPFCPGNEYLTPQEIFALRDGDTWLTRVVPNLYKALQIEAPRNAQNRGFYERWGGYGAHEVIIDTPQHNATLATMKHQHIVAWLSTLQARISDLAHDPNLISIAIFKNSGALAGATQPHPHTQLIASQLLSKYHNSLFTHLWHYYQEHGRSLLLDIFTNEMQQERSIYATQDFLTFAPYASAFAFETMIVAKGIFSLKECTKAQLHQLASHIKYIFNALYNELGDFSYNLLFFTPPMHKNFQNECYYDDLQSFFTFFVRITPRIYTLAGYELLTHSAINPVTPELAASLLRKHYASSA